MMGLNAIKCGVYRMLGYSDICAIKGHSLHELVGTGYVRKGARDKLYVPAKKISCRRWHCRYEKDFPLTPDSNIAGGQ
jgi:hypothetical protein